jgi:hypothetical protein
MSLSVETSVLGIPYQILIFDEISHPFTSPKSNPAKHHHFTYTIPSEHGFHIGN